MLNNALKKFLARVVTDQPMHFCDAIAQLRISEEIDVLDAEPKYKNHRLDWKLAFGDMQIKSASIEKH